MKHPMEAADESWARVEQTRKRITEARKILRGHVEALNLPPEQRKAYDAAFKWVLWLTAELTVHQRNHNELMDIAMGDQ